LTLESNTADNIEEQYVTTIILDDEKQKSVIISSNKSKFKYMKFLFLSNRSTNILQINTMLREQLDQAHLANQQLTEDLRRATTELQQIRNDFTQKSRDWKEEERVEFLEIFLFFLSKNISSGF
jgi:hypothetical protein